MFPFVPWPLLIPFQSRIGTGISAMEREGENLQSLDEIARGHLRAIQREEF